MHPLKQMQYKVCFIEFASFSTVLIIYLQATHGVTIANDGLYKHSMTIANKSASGSQCILNMFMPSWLIDVVSPDGLSNITTSLSYNHMAVFYRDGKSYLPCVLTRTHLHLLLVALYDYHLGMFLPFDSYSLLLS